MIKFLKQKKVFSTIVFLLINFISFSQKINNNGAIINMYNHVYLGTGDLNNTSGSIKADQSTIQIGGVINSNGNIDVTNGAVDMNGASSPQTIPSAAFTTNKILDLIINNDVTLAGEDSITETLSFGSSNRTFETGGYLTLKSTIDATARVADLTNNGANSGNTVTDDVHVERYIQSHRAWRLLTAPLISGAQTVNEAWQEGQIGTNNIPGFGTHITGGTAANGFDNGVRNSNPAIQTYNGTGWTRLSATNTGSITDYPGYMVFIRGSRAVDLSLGVNAPADATVVRSTGELKEGPQVMSSGTGFAVAGNPFASSINFHTAAKNGLGDTYYLWDPLLTGTNKIGGYITLSWNGSDYTAAPEPVSAIETTGRIESGSAFFVDFTSSGSLTIDETDKLPGSLPVSRPVDRHIPQLRSNLYSINSDNTISLVDGVVANYGDAYSNDIDNYDARKLTNFAENFAMKRNNKLLAIERRGQINRNDTIFFNMTQMRVKSYRFDFIAANLSAPGLQAFFEDNYAKTSSPVNLEGLTQANFSVKNDSGSYASDRFRIVFKPAAPLPVTFVSINAYRKTPAIFIDWKVDNENSVKQYEVEHSLDGNQFNFIKSLSPVANNGSKASYSIPDNNASPADNFYRIKITDIDGKVRYSAIVKVGSIETQGEIKVYANTITNGTINLQFSNMPAGKYNARVINSLGEVLLSKEISRMQGSSLELLQLSRNTSGGLYHIEVICPDKSIINIKIVN